MKKTINKVRKPKNSWENTFTVCMPRSSATVIESSHSKKTEKLVKGSSQGNQEVSQRERMLHFTHN
jgi:hypothetical protein